MEENQAKHWLRAIGRFLFHGVIWAGALSCILVWIGIKPSDLWGWNVTFPHWIWLLLSLILFCLGMFASGLSLYRSLKPKVIVQEVLKEVIKEVEKAPTPSKLVIHSAKYAAIDGNGRTYDVTEFLRRIIFGDGLVFEVENHNFVIDGENFVPKDPLFGKPKRLQVKYAFDGDIEKLIEREEHDRLVLPEDTCVERELDHWRSAYYRESSERADWQKKYATEAYKVSDLEQKLMALDTPQPQSLRDRTISMFDRLAAFANENPESKLTRGATESGEDYTTRILAWAVEWHGRLAARFRLQFEQELCTLSDEIQVSYGVSNGLRDTVHQATRSCDLKTIETIRSQLWRLAEKMGQVRDE